jgi:pilus assembly protein Flp/PilA
MIEAVHEKLVHLLADRRAVTAVEYGLIAGAIAVTIIGAVVLIGSDIVSLFTSTSSAISSSAK